MGFFDNLGKVVKDTGKKISDELERRREIRKTKEQILSRFEMGELKQICKDYGVQEPNPYGRDLISGEKYKRTLTRDDYIECVISGLTLDQIKTFSDKHRIKIWDLLKEDTKSMKMVSDVQEIKTITSIEVKRQDEFDSILESIEKDFEPEDVRDENDFEKQLTQFLKIKYPDRIRRQMETQKGKIDLVIDDKYAIELKIADNKGKLRDLVGQAHSYKKVYNNVAVILLDVGKLTRSEIKEYLEDYENLGVKTLVLEGILKRRKNKGKQINIRI